MKQSYSKIALALGFVGSTLLINTAYAESLVAINSNNQYSVFDTANVIGASFNNITGLAVNESFIGIDLRPSTNTVYGISTFNRIYTLDTTSGATTFVAALSVPIYDAPARLGYGLDFNPILDRTTPASLRVVTSAGSNLAVNVLTGDVATQTPIAKGFTGIAYNNSDPSQAGPPADIDLYYINSETDRLSEALMNFANPQIDDIGPLGFDILKANGYEILGNNNSYAAVNLDGGTLDTFLLSVNLDSGVGTNLGRFNGTINGLAGAPLNLVAPSEVPVPAALPLMATALALFGLGRRRGI